MTQCNGSDDLLVTPHIRERYDALLERHGMASMRHDSRFDRYVYMYASNDAEALAIRNALRAYADATSGADCPVCGGRGWHTAGGNDPAACGRCPAGEAWASADPLPGTEQGA